MVLYDGLHYDAIATAAFIDAPEEVDCTVFDPAAPDAKQVCSVVVQCASYSLMIAALTHTISRSLRLQKGWWQA